MFSDSSEGLQSVRQRKMSGVDVADQLTPPGLEPQLNLQKELASITAGS